MEYSKLKMAELQEEAQKRGINTEGLKSKAEVIAALEADDAAQEAALEEKAETAPEETSEEQQGPADDEYKDPEETDTDEQEPTDETPAELQEEAQKESTVTPVNSAFDAEYARRLNAVSKNRHVEASAFDAELARRQGKKVHALSFEEELRIRKQKANKR